MIDFKKDTTYKAKTEPEIIEVPEMKFVMVDGEGAPEGSDDASTEFQEAMGILFGIVYTIKFWDKKYDPPAGYDKFSMPPIDGLWWTKSGKEFDSKKPDDWKWTVMLRVPDFVTQDFFDQVVEEVSTRKKTDIYKKARLSRLNEGQSVQLMHIGPYDQEDANILKMHAYAVDHGYNLVGKHHELYFSDPRRTAPEKLKTILRQPVLKAS